MSNPLKRHFDPVRELDDEAVNSMTNITSILDSGQFQEQQIWNYGEFLDLPRQSQYLGPSYANPESEIPVMQQSDSLPDLFSEILLDPSVGSQMMSTNLNDTSDYNIDGALTEWGSGVALSDSDFSQLIPDSSQDSSNLSSLTPESSQSMTHNVPAADDNEIICYGMLHNVDVKLVGEMQAIHSKLNKSELGFQHFTLKEQEDHILLCFRDGGEEFGYLRSAEASALKPLLAKSFIEFEPFISTSYLMDIIGRANKSSEAIMKVDINVYGPLHAAAELGDTLSRDKLWLQKSTYLRSGVSYDNPHFLRLEINGIQVQPVQPVTQAASEGITSRKGRQERLRKMVEEVYKSLDRTRHLDMVEGGDKVARKLLKHQQEALGFMLERESGHINDKYRLWETKILEDGSEEYRHRITKARIRNGAQPNERGGGILADEMGMGKSLSILALIMKMLDDGKTWAQQQVDGGIGEEEVKRSRSTLVIVPSALLIYNWMNEIKEHLKDGVKVIKYHGSGRPEDLDTVLDSDIVLTTYSTLTFEFQTKSNPSLLHLIDWYRIVLDEAHIIRRRATVFYHACDALHANSRWCLTGTPIQNKLADIGTLFAFIRAEPFCKAAIFRKWIEAPFDKSAVDLTTVKDRLVILIEALCLRRTKDVIHLPQLRQHIRILEFSPAERKQYEDTKMILMRTIRHRVGEIEKSSKFGLFQANLQMRLLCNHGTYQQPFSWRRRSYREEREAVMSALGQNGEITCSGCQLPMPILGSSRPGDDFYKQCAHVLCSECIEQSNTQREGAQAQHCPVCVLLSRPSLPEGNTTTSDMSIPGYPAREHAGGDDACYFSSTGHSTKMQALIKDICKDLWMSKSIVFSCWTRTLQLLSKYLEEANIPYLRIDGGCSLSQRQIKLDQFAKDDETPILIMTTGTGGFGLNLTCANRIFIVELQWNPGVESQAIARAIRLGQKNRVHVTRYMIKGTVEEEMKSQQHWKKQLTTLGFDDREDDNDEEFLCADE